MPDGYIGRVLHVDLSSNEFWVEEPGELFYRTYWGGGCLGAYYLFTGMPRGVDALSPDNLLIFAPGVTTGVPAPGLAVHAVVAKSPMTGGIGEGHSTGFWGAELKRAGFDAVVIKGRAEKPAYLWIHDGQAEIRPAEHLWGQFTADAEEAIQEELGDLEVRVSVIGPAAEKLVRFACISNDIIFTNGHMGLGAVMGSKNLKAVAVRGTQPVQVAEPETVRRLATHFRENFMENPVNQRTYESSIAGFIGPLTDLFSAHNSRTTGWEGAHKINGDWYQDRYLDQRIHCFGCYGGCRRTLKGTEELGVDHRCGQPEMDTLAGFGCQCLVDDPVVMLKATEICRQYGLEYVCAGGTIAFAMDCFEAGLLTAEDTGGLELRFGEGGALLETLELIAKREGIGDLLAEGSLRAARRIGRGAEKFAMQSKGLEMPGHDPRPKAMLGLACAVNPVGPDTFAVEHDTDFDFEAPQLFMDQISPLGLFERLEGNNLGPRKIRMLRYLHPQFSFMDAACLCIFAFAPVRFYRFSEMVALLSAVTGWETSLWELQKLGERRLAMGRMFNFREGLSAADDTLPDRYFEPIPSGPRKGLSLDRKKFEEVKQLYYAMLGWDTNGVPNQSTLIELGLDWLV